MSDELTDIIQIADEQIPVSEVAQRVQEGLRAHGLDESVQFPQFEAVPQEEGEGASFPSALYHDLRRAAEARSETRVALQPVDSPIPLLGRLKRALHELVVFYVNLLADRQARLNDALFRVLNGVVGRMDQLNPEVKALRQEVAELRARLERLEEGES